MLTSQVIRPVFSTSSIGYGFFVFWLLMAMILSSWFKSNLLAHLVAVEYEKPIQNSQVVYSIYLYLRSYSRRCELDWVFSGSVEFRQVLVCGQVLGSPFLP